MSSKSLAVTAFFVASLGVGCSSSGTSKRPYVGDVRANTELLAADRAFARDTSERGIDAWVDGFADDGVVMSAGVPLVKGKGEIREAMEPLLNDPTNHLEWDPDRVWVSGSGDLGYTLGHTTVTKVVPGGGAEITLVKLKYMSVWRRQADGRWKVAATVGTSEP